MANVYSSADLARRIQLTLINNAVTADQIKSLCHTCLEYGFNAAMVPGNWVTLANRQLAGSKVIVASAVDFPWGVATTAGRAAEARALVEAGARQVDVMVQLGYFLSGMDDAVREDLAAIVAAARPAEVKVMLELPLLSAAQRERIVRLAVAAGVHWLKNASGGAVGVATPEDIRFLKERAPQGVRVKASGGIKTAEQMAALLDAGAELVGTSSGVAIVTGAKATAVDNY
ncbi:MAG: deoxyribose-phosphate aldolase [Symbiobacteriia bacterium]